MHSASVDVAQRQRRCKHAIGADGARYGPITLARRKARAAPKPDSRYSANFSSQSRPASAKMFGWVLAVILLGYLVPHFLIGLLPTQDLKKKVRFVARCEDACTPVLTGST